MQITVLAEAQHVPNLRSQVSDRGRAAGPSQVPVPRWNPLRIIAPGVPHAHAYPGEVPRLIAHPGPPLVHH